MDKLALIEVLDREGHVQATHAVWRWPVTIGRALECDLVLDDPHVAAHHATLAPDDGGDLRLRVGDTVNGARVDGRVLGAGDEAALGRSAQLLFGHSRLKLRLPGEALAAERPLAAAGARPHRSTVVMALAALGWLAALRWVELEPGASWSQWLSVLLGAPVALVGWALLWGLGSKLFLRRFEFGVHLRLTLAYFLVAAVAELVLHTASFMTGWAWPAHLAPLVQSALLVALLHAQLSEVLPHLRRTLGAALVSLFVVGQGVMMALNHQRTDRFFDDLYATTLGPPALRLAPAVPTRQFIQEAQGLREALERRARADEANDAGDDAP